MNVYAIPPLLAVIAYIPLLSVLSVNRPWKKEHRLLFLYLLPAMLWSFVDCLFRSTFSPEHKLFLVKAVLLFALWTGIQFIFILRYFPKRKFNRLYLAYILLLAFAGLEVLGYIPQGIDITASGLHVQYGILCFSFVIVLLLIASPDLYSLSFRVINTKNLEERNQISYLLVGVAFITVSGVASFIPGGGQFPLAHIGNIALASILSYVFLKHRLLDIRFITRRVLVWLGLIAVGVILYFVMFLLIHSFTSINIDAGTLALAIMAAIAVGGSVYLLYGFFSRRTDRLFYRARYDYLEKLRIFLRYRLNRVLSLSELSEGLLPLLAGTLHCKQIDLFLPDSTDGDFVVQFSEPGTKEVAKARISQDNPLLEWLRRENSYLLRENLDVFPELYGRWGEERDGLKSLDMEILFPLISRGDLIAILALGKKESGRYSLEDVNLVETVTSQVAASLEKEYLQDQFRKREKEHLQKELTKREQELALINRLAAVITSSLNMREVYDAFIAELKDVVSVDWATIALIEGDEIRLEVISTEVGSAWQAGEKMRLKGTGTEWVANHKEALVEPDLTKSRRFSTGEGHIKQGIRSIVYLPLIVKNKAIGSLIVASCRPSAYSPAQVLLLERLAFQIAMPIENTRLYAKAEQRARIDEITGLFNRRYFNECIKLEIERHARYSGMMSLILLDLDYFKAYNDVQGHTAGDKILELIGRLVNGGLRNTDLAFRYGGDEFAIILPQSGADDAFIVAERVRRKIAVEMSKKNIKLSASFGLACWPLDGYTSGDMVNAADRALYHAKQSGGNRTCIFSKIPSSTGEVAGVQVRDKHKL
jgi:diguanylate cyclase (GGDEF)-like protein